MVKACNQILVALTIAAVAEALVLGAKAGVDPAKIVEVLSGGLARCGVLENRGKRIVARDFPARLSLSSCTTRTCGSSSTPRKDYGVPLPDHQPRARAIQAHDRRRSRRL